MDTFSLVDGGADGLVRIAEEFRAKGIDVVGIYLIKATSSDDDVRWTIRLVTSERSVHVKRRMIVALIDLRRAQALPWIDDTVRFDIVPVDHPEASRIIDYAHALGGRTPVIIRDTMWQGMFIEHAMVAIIPESDKVAA